MLFPNESNNSIPITKSSMYHVLKKYIEKILNPNGEKKIINLIKFFSDNWNHSNKFTVPYNSTTNNSQEECFFFFKKKNKIKKKKKKFF